jgi:hypothetical protein
MSPLTNVPGADVLILFAVVAVVAEPDELA